MMNKLSIAAALLCLGVLQGCSDPHTFEVSKLTESQSKEIAQKLTEDEKTKLAGWMVRNKLSQAFGGVDMTVGVTIGQAIKQQEVWLAKEKADDDARAALQAKSEAEKVTKKLAYDKKQEEFSKLLTIAVVSKKNREGEYGRRAVLFDIAYQNNSGKAVRAVSGRILITSLFDEPIMHVKWETIHPLPAGAHWVETGSGIEINQFIPSHVKLYQTDYKDLKIRFTIDKIIYEDGTSDQVPSED